MIKENKRNIIVSGINIHEGGALTIYRDCLMNLVANFSSEYNVIALVQSKMLFNIDNIEYIEFPNARRSWFHKIYYEYFYFYRISKSLVPFLWLSLNDCSPRIKARIRAVYCHNAAPFFKRSLTDLLVFSRLFFQSFYYNLFYMINIKKNQFVIVQQYWMMDNMIRRYHILKERMIVSPPKINELSSTENSPSAYKEKGVLLFLYPSLPRSYKNFEFICEAAELLEQKNFTNYSILLTLDGTENIYSSRVVKKYKYLSTVRFIGVQNREDLFRLYRDVDCLIFPSKCETSGLPILEFKRFNKPVLLANMPYAKESANGYRMCRYFDLDSPKELSQCIEDLINGDIVYINNEYLYRSPSPIYGWDKLFNVLLGKKGLDMNY